MQDGDHDHTCTDSTSEGERGTTNTDPVTTTGENTNNNNIWVRNILSTHLTKAQEKILSRGPNFAIVHKSPPVGKYIASIENACSQLRQGEVEDLRGEIKTILKKVQPPKSNITREERRALEELRKDKSNIILTADKGVSLVVIDEDEYIRKAQALFGPTRIQIHPSRPNNKIQEQAHLHLEEHKGRGWNK